MDYPANSNGSIHAIAGLCNETGRLFGLMPHPEAFLYRTNHPRWTRENLAGRRARSGYFPQRDKFYPQYGVLIPRLGIPRLQPGEECAPPDQVEGKLHSREVAFSSAACCGICFQSLLWGFIPVIFQTACIDSHVIDSLFPLPYNILR